MNPAKKRILVVEDNPLLQRMLSDFLTHQGYELLTATDGDQAIRIAEQDRPDLILMDIQLPTVSGLEATRAIKANAATAHIPIIAVTGFALASDAEMCRAAGCDEYVTKPYDLDEMLVRVQRFVN